MRDLIGRLTPLDPQASEALKVVDYFDALTSRGVGLGGLLRAAAALAGTDAGAEIRGTTVIYAPDGRKKLAEAAGRPAPGRSAAPIGADGTSEAAGPGPDDTGPGRAASASFRGGSVWLDREGEPHANDAMILRRLALAVEALESQHGRTSAIEVIVDADRSLVERTTALAELGIDPADRIRIVLSSPDGGMTSRRSGVVPGPSGPLTTSIHLGEEETITGPAGIGTWTRADHAPESWRDATIAYRLVAADTAPVVDATELGPMLMLAVAYDPQQPHPDVLALAELDAHSREILRALVDSDSLRAAATHLAMHHSTLQVRYANLCETIGYDPRSTSGRIRFISAEFLRRLSG
jgi:hypothetical protein